jgi:SAM-dependent methyltransferase
MSIELINERKREIVGRFGPWTAHNIHLVGDTYTIDKRIVGDEIKLRRIIQMISDIAGEPLEKLRILDLACLEGLYAIELARHGSRVVGIEGREANIEKARFAKDVLSLENLEFFQDDVRNLSREKYGQFDVVLCLGILYHLDVPNVFSFIEKIAEVCQRFAIIGTHVSIRAKTFSRYNGRKYWGKRLIEHSTSSTPEERAKSLWGSLDNLRSFWFTRPSLYNLLFHVGFTSVYECHNPPELEKLHDRITLLAIKGRRRTLISAPLVSVLPEDGWPERQKFKTHPGQKWYFNTVRKIGELLPNRIKKTMKKFLRCRSKFT